MVFPRSTSFEKTRITFFTTTLSRTAATTTMKMASVYCTFFLLHTQSTSFFHLHPLHCSKESQFQNKDLSGNQTGMQLKDEKILTLTCIKKIDHFGCWWHFCLSKAWQMELWPAVCFIQSYIYSCHYAKRTQVPVCHQTFWHHLATITHFDTNSKW